MTNLAGCPLCGDSQRICMFGVADPLSSDRFEVTRCQSCKLAYVTPRPEPEKLAAYYAAGYFGNRHPILKRFFMDVRVRALSSPPGRLLDIGCGCGDFLMACRRRGWHVAGVEQSEAPVLELQSALGLKILTATDLHRLPNGSFDAVTMWHVLEHMADPRKTLREVLRLLRPGGEMLIEVPNFGSWQARIGPQYWFHLDVPRHLLHFEQATLSAMLAAEGFACERWATFSAEYDAFGMMQSLLNRICPTPNWLFQLLIGCRPPRTTVRDVLGTVLTAVPLAVLSVLVSTIAPMMGGGGVLRVLARKPLRA